MRQLLDRLAARPALGLLEVEPPGPSTHVIASVAAPPQLVATIDGGLTGTH